MTVCTCGLESFGYSGCYSHLKDRGLDGGRLTSEERAFAVSAPSPAPSGRLALDSIPSLAAFHDEDGELFMSDAEKRLLQMLIDPPGGGVTA